MVGFVGPELTRTYYSVHENIHICRQAYVMRPKRRAPDAHYARLARAGGMRSAGKG